MVDPRITAGRTVGPYRLEQKLGEGGMGTVYLARTIVGEHVAVKLLHRHLYRERVLVERFRREAEAGVMLQHPAIVRTLGTGETADGFHYFAMEYFRGRTMEEILRRHGPLAELQALAVAYEVARALDHAHRKGVFHRDIKPGNIMINRTGDVQVADFGLALVLSDDRDVQPGTFMGTPAYCPPEQLRGEEVDGRTDLYALGVTLYEMLTGSPAHPGGSPQEVMKQVLDGAVRPIGDFRDDVSAETVALVAHMTAQAKEERPPYAARVMETLAAQLERLVGAARTAAEFTERLRTEAQKAFLGAIEHDTGDPAAFPSTEPALDSDPAGPPANETQPTRPDEAYASAPALAQAPPHDHPNEHNEVRMEPDTRDAPATAATSTAPREYGVELARYRREAAERRARLVVVGLFIVAAILFWLTGAARAVAAFVGGLFGS